MNYIGDYAFAGSYNFLKNSASTRLDLPASIERISKNAFSYYILATTILEGLRPRIINFYGCKKLQIIGERAFASWTPATAQDKFIGKIEGLDTCTSLESIEYEAFSNSGTIYSISPFPASLKVIRGKAFYNCYSLSSIDLSLSTNITEIGEYAFGLISHGIDTIYMPTEHLLAAYFPPRSITKWIAFSNVDRFILNESDIKSNDDVTLLKKNFPDLFCAPVNKLFLNYENRENFETLKSSFINNYQLNSTKFYNQTPLTFDNFYVSTGGKETSIEEGYSATFTIQVDTELGVRPFKLDDKNYECSIINFNAHDKTGHPVDAFIHQNGDFTFEIDATDSKLLPVGSYFINFDIKIKNNNGTDDPYIIYNDKDCLKSNETIVAIVNCGYDISATRIVALQNMQDEQTFAINVKSHSSIQSNALVMWNSSDTGIVTFSSEATQTGEDNTIIIHPITVEYDKVQTVTISAKIANFQITKYCTIYIFPRSLGISLSYTQTNVLKTGGMIGIIGTINNLSPEDADNLLIYWDAYLDEECTKPFTYCRFNIERGTKSSYIQYAKVADCSHTSYTKFYIVGYVGYDIGDDKSSIKTKCEVTLTENDALIVEWETNQYINYQEYTANNDNFKKWTIWKSNIDITNSEKLSCQLVNINGSNLEIEHLHWDKGYFTWDDKIPQGLYSIALCFTYGGYHIMTSAQFQFISKEFTLVGGSSTLYGTNYKSGSDTYNWKIEQSVSYSVVSCSVIDFETQSKAENINVTIDGLVYWGNLESDVYTIFVRFVIVFSNKEYIVDSPSITLSIFSNQNITGGNTILKAQKDTKGSDSRPWTFINPYGEAVEKIHWDLVNAPSWVYLDDRNVVCWNGCSTPTSVTFEVEAIIVFVNGQIEICKSAPIVLTISEFKIISETEFTTYVANDGFISIQAQLDGVNVSDKLSITILKTTGNKFSTYSNEIHWDNLTVGTYHLKIRIEYFDFSIYSEIQDITIHLKQAYVSNDIIIMIATLSTVLPLSIAAGVLIPLLIKKSKSKKGISCGQK